MTSQRYDPEVIDEHVTAMLRRLKSSRRDYVHRLRRFGRAAEVLLKPRGAVFLIGHPETGLTAAEVYGGLWLILISDVFRDEDQRAAFARDALVITDEEWQDVLRLTTLLSERYFGVPVLPDEGADE